MNQRVAIAAILLLLVVVTFGTGYAVAAATSADSDSSIWAERMADDYHGNTDSKIFHKSTCRYYNCKNCTAVFTSKDAATKAGYRACKVCKP